MIAFAASKTVARSKATTHPSFIALGFQGASPLQRPSGLLEDLVDRDYRKD